MPRSPVLIVIILAGLVSACARGGSASRPRPDAGRPAVESRPSDPLAPPWVVRRAGEPVSQTIHIAAVLESSTDSSRPPVSDTLQSQLTVTWTLPSSGYPRRYLGAVTDYRLSSAVGDSLTPLAGVPLPFAFSAEQPAEGTQPAFVSPDASACGAPQASVVHGVRDLWLSLPDTLRPGMNWSDSVTYVVCRDSIPLTTAVQREFRVTGAIWRDSAVVVTVERRTATRLSGVGRQFGDSVHLTGEGTGAAMFEISLHSGAATFASGESELRVTLRGSRRTQQLTQRSRISILDR